VKNGKKLQERIEHYQLNKDDLSYWHLRKQEWQWQTRLNKILNTLY